MYYKLFVIQTIIFINTFSTPVTISSRIQNKTSKHTSQTYTFQMVFETYVTRIREYVLDLIPSLATRTVEQRIRGEARSRVFFERYLQ